MAGPVISFYGVEDPEMFRLEREAMDRQGLVVAALDRLLPRRGRVLDVGAGDGHTARLLESKERAVTGLEPAMAPRHRIDGGWVRGAAPDMPFSSDSFDAAYSTWAYFFPNHLDVRPALAELERVVKPGGVLAIVDNAGDDQFCSMTDRKIATDPTVWVDLGFGVEIIETAFEFESMSDAERLLQFFFGPTTQPTLRIEFRVAVASRPVP